VISRNRRSILSIASVAAALILSGCGGSSSAPANSVAGGETSESTVEPTIPTGEAPESIAAPPVAYGETACAPAAGTAAPVRAFPGSFAKCIDAAKTYTATMVTSEGTMTFTLLDEKSPITVNNFVNLGRSKYYDGIFFHRVVSDFVLQAGDPTVLSADAVTSPSAGSGGPGYDFADELPAAGEYKIGDLAMANAGPNTNGSQFFVISGPNGTTLPPNYSLFGSIADDPASKATLEAIAALAVAGQDGPPSKPVSIESVTITEQ
jgi:cyclophilin family peptidyl-prolyl cis-trans isomerase